MANEVYANGREIACKASSGQVIAGFPDVCLSPPSPPAGPVPIPYPNTAAASDTTNGSKTVQISGQEVMLKDSSSFKKSTGNEAATKSFGMGVVTHQIQGEASFMSWSMDVKIEGANVDRHLDMMMHNEQSSPGQVLAWPFQSKASLAKPDNPCHTEAKEVNKNCSKPPEDCYTDDCCEARKCMMVPGDLKNNKCCDGENGEKMTPHHVVPVMDHYTKSSLRNVPAEESKKYLPDGSKGYDQNTAPCICAEGHDHGAEEEPGRLMEHGRIGRATAYVRNQMVEPGGTYKYEDIAAPTAVIVGQVKGCDPNCIEQQMNQYHSKNSKGPLRRSRQAVKGGDEYAAEALGDEELYTG